MRWDLIQLSIELALEGKREREEGKGSSLERPNSDKQERGERAPSTSSSSSIAGYAGDERCAGGGVGD